MKHKGALTKMTGLTLILTLLAACASPAPTATPTAVQPVEVEAIAVTFEPEHCIYDGPKVIGQGEVTVTLNNLTDHEVAVRFGKFEEGKSWQDLVSHFAEKNQGVLFPDWFPRLGHRPVIGDYETWKFTFEPGNYGMVCVETLQGAWATWLASPLEVR